MIDTVIFDMDGVLLDSEPIHQRVNLHYFRSLGVTLSQEFYEQNFIGLPLVRMLSYLKDEYHLQQELADMMAQCTALLHQDFAQSELCPLPGVVELLEVLHARGLQLGVGSSSPPDLIGLITQKLRIAGYFQHLVSGYQVQRGKPNPDIFLRVAELLTSLPEQCVVIEDSALGLEAAYRAGMKAVGVKNDTSHQNMNRATLTVAGFSDADRQRILDALLEW